MIEFLVRNEEEDFAVSEQINEKYLTHLALLDDEDAAEFAKFIFLSFCRNSNINAPKTLSDINSFSQRNDEVVSYLNDNYTPKRLRTNIHDMFIIAAENEILLASIEEAYQTYEVLNSQAGLIQNTFIVGSLCLLLLVSKCENIEIKSDSVSASFHDVNVEFIDKIAPLITKIK